MGTPAGPPARLPLLTDSVKQPHVLLWVSALPQFILLLLNLHYYWIVSGDVTATQKHAWMLLLGFNGFFLLGVTALALSLRARKRLVPWGANWPLLLLPVACLGALLFNVWDLVPDSAAIWILPPWEVLYFQFVFMMPVIFYATVRLACVDLKISRVQEVLWTAGAIFAPPFFWFMILWFTRAMEFWEVPVIVFITLGIVSTVIMVAAIARTCVAGFVALQRSKSPAAPLLMFLICVCAPLAGLWLNSRIPFPADFQSWPVYGMALLNGCIVLLPRFGQPMLRRVVWLAQCALFPFTLYFFLVFLPFLPFSIPAIIIYGAGFLILTPTVLFLVHGQKILWGYREEMRDAGRFVPTLLGVAAVAILPGIVIGEAGIDRMCLNKAIDYVYNPDYRAGYDHFTGNRDAVGRSLERLRDFKSGLYLPFLSDFYDWAVFGNLVLPDEKMNTIHRALFGRDLDPAKSDRIDFLGGRPERNRTRVEAHPAPTPNDNIGVSEMTAQTAPDGDCERRTVTLKIANSGNARGQFVTDIHIPDGVLISGFRLRIGKEDVAGRIFEKKTALWVYEMIRGVTTRDPGILIYTDPNTVELRVFPVERNEMRQVEIEFLYPAALNPDIRIGNQPQEKESPAASIVLTPMTDGAATATVSPAMLAQLPAAPRTPYLHFIVDRSTNVKLTDDKILAAIRAAAAQFPGAKECAITFANYESVTQGDPPREMHPGVNSARDAIPLLAIDSLNATSLGDGRLLPARGGFLAGRAMKRALLAYHDKLSHADANNPWLGKYPVFIVIHDPQDKPAFDNDLLPFEKFAPDMDRFFTTENGDAISIFDFNGHLDIGKAFDSVVSGTTISPMKSAPPRPVVLLELGDSITPCPVVSGETQTVAFDAAKSAGPRTLGVLDHGLFSGLKPTATIAADSPYARGMLAWRQYLEWVYNPSSGNDGLAGVVRMSRESGILTAATSFIVVENSAQWKELQLKQKQKLGNKTALEFTETPEPATWALLCMGLGLLCLGWRRQRRRRT